RIEGVSHRVAQGHGGDVSAGFERSVRLAVERRQFWSQFCEVPEVVADTAEIVRDWSAARAAVTAALRRKQASPLEATALDQPERSALAAYGTHRQQIAALSDMLIQANAAIEV